MVWRVPTREIGAVSYQELGLELPPEYITSDTGKLSMEHVPLHETLVAFW